MAVPHRILVVLLIIALLAQVQQPMTNVHKLDVRKTVTVQPRILTAIAQKINACKGAELPALLQDLNSKTVVAQI